MRGQTSPLRDESCLREERLRYLLTSLQAKLPEERLRKLLKQVERFTLYPTLALQYGYGHREIAVATWKKEGYQATKLLELNNDLLVSCKIPGTYNMLLMEYTDPENFNLVVLNVETDNKSVLGSFKTGSMISPWYNKESWYLVHFKTELKVHKFNEDFRVLEVALGVDVKLFEQPKENSSPCSREGDKLFVVLRGLGRFLFGKILRATKNFAPRKR